MNLDAFIGTWRADDGRQLIVRSEATGVSVDALDAAGKPFRKIELGLSSVLPDALAPKTLGLPAVEKSGSLVVETGTVGLGPTLELTLQPLGGRAAMIPQLHIGLYDDFDDDLGVPWAVPLAPFFRVD